MRPDFSISFSPVVAVSSDVKFLDAETWENFSESLKKFLESFRVTFFGDGNFLAEWLRFLPQDAVWVRDLIRQRRLELLGGTYHDVVLPFFPEKMIQLQIERHKDLLEKRFSMEPVGFFNQSLIWEIGLTSMLSKENFAYTFVKDSSLAEVLDREGRAISGWFSTENGGRLLRLLPVNTALSSAFLADEKLWEKEWKNLPEEENPRIVLHVLSSSCAKDPKAFFEKLKEAYSIAECQTWTVSHIIEQRPSSGRVHLSSAVGNGLGLLPMSRSSSELLLVRPEIYFIHKAWISVLRLAERELSGRDFDEIAEILLPVMDKKYFSHTPEGVLNPQNRFFVHSEILRASLNADSILQREPLRFELTDYLLTGEQQVFVDNSKVSFLLEPSHGAVLRSLNLKNERVNFLNALNEEGYEAPAFLEHIFLPEFSSASELTRLLSSRAGALLSAYEFRIERSSANLQIKMSSEQVAPVEGKAFIFHLEKNISLSLAKEKLSLSYKLSNMMYQEYSGYFGSEIELGTFSSARVPLILKIDRMKAEFDDSSPVIFSDIRSFRYEDSFSKAFLSCEFDEPVSLLVSPVWNGEKTVLQGRRLFFFKPIEMNGMDEVEFVARVELGKSRGFL